MIYNSFESASLTMHHSRDDAPDERDFPMHSHDRFELYCFLSGQGYFSVEGRQYPLRPLCFLLFRDGETHKLHISPEQPYERIAVHFSPRALNCSPIISPLCSLFYDRPLGERNAYYPEGDDLERLGALAMRLASPERTAAQEQSIFCHLLAVLSELSELTHAPAAAVSGKEGELVRGVITYINENLATLSGVAELEAHFYFSRSYINRLFRAAAGVSVWEYVTVKRLHTARSMIKAGSTPALAAAAAGFGDYSSFYRQYRSRFGAAPSADRSHRDKNKPKR